MNIAVLGCGMVGQTIAVDLAKKHEVTSFDASQTALQAIQAKEPLVKPVQVDLRRHSAYEKMLHPFDLVIAAVPGFMGFQTLEAVIKAKKNVIDISFFPENALQLNELAKNCNVTAIVDCGVAPGVSNLIIGRYNETMEVEYFECYVGGLPKIRRKPFEYKAPFSPIDVIEEYTRPARLKENGKIIVKPALSEVELIDFDGIGTLEAFNTDGLRSILDTMPHVPNLKEKTLRYPGHAQFVESLKRSGFFSTDIIHVNNISVNPLEFTTAILLKEWKLSPLDEEFTVMKVVVKGKMNGSETTVEYNLIDFFDPVTRTSSMSRTTGFTCTATANVFAEGLFTQKGVSPPEVVGKDEKCFNYIMQYLKQRNVNWIKEKY